MKAMVSQPDGLNPWKNPYAVFNLFKSSGVTKFRISSPPKNWLDMPDHIMSMILCKVGAFDIFRNVRYVCSSWHKICKDPYFWRVVDFHNSHNRFDKDYDLEKMCLKAVANSCGQLRDIKIEYFGSNKLLQYISKSSPQLKKLKIVRSFTISDQEIIEAVVQFPLLEHLEISSSLFSVEALKIIGLCCPLLKSLKLEIRFKSLTYGGLEDILNSGFPSLESYELRLYDNKYFPEKKLKRYCVGTTRDLLDDYFGSEVDFVDDFYPLVDDDYFYYNF